MAGNTRATLAGNSGNNHELEHVIRASGQFSGDDEIIIIGRQAILGKSPDAPIRLLSSMEADAYPKNYPEKADTVDGA